MNYDDIFEGGAAQPQQDTFDKEAWAAKKKEERELVYGIIDQTALTLATDPALFKTYLDVQCHFDRYSVSNTLLITAQKPEATKLGDFNYWKRQQGSIKKGQQGIYLLEPGDEYRKDDGSVGVSYNPKRVFDQAQTTARKTLSPLVNHSDRTLVQALVHQSGTPVKAAEELPFGAKGAIFDPIRNAIFVQRGMSGADIFRSLAAEMAHVEFANGDSGYHRNSMTFAAYCVSYMLAKRNNIDVSNYHFNAVPEEYSKMDAQEIRDELSCINTACTDITARMQGILSRVKPEPAPER
jgi:hypothetical protein